MTLLTTFAKWHKESGSVEDGAVGKSVAALELSAGSLIVDLKTKRSEIVQAAVVQTDPDVRPKIPTIIKTSTNTSKFSNTVIPKRTYSEPSLAAPEALSNFLPRRAGTSDYGQRLAAIVPRKGDKSSKAGSRASSKASSAAKLQLRIDEAEARVEADFDREVSDRDRRKIARDARKLEIEFEMQQKQFEMQQKQLEFERERLADEDAERETMIRKKKRQY